MGGDQKKGKMGKIKKFSHIPQKFPRSGCPRYYFRPPKNDPPRATIFDRRLQEWDTQ
jgi:hypothetical protein